MRSGQDLNVAVIAFGSTAVVITSRFPRLLPLGPTLAGAEGFEPPSPVLETGSLTVELTPLKPIGNLRFVIGDLKTAVVRAFQLQITNHQLQITSLLCAACACGTGGRTFSVPGGPASSCGSSWSSNSALCTHHTAT